MFPFTILLIPVTVAALSVSIGLTAKDVVSLINLANAIDNNGGNYYGGGIFGGSSSSPLTQTSHLSSFTFGNNPSQTSSDTDFPSFSSLFGDGSGSDEQLESILFSDSDLTFRRRSSIQQPSVPTGTVQNKRVLPGSPTSAPIVVRRQTTVKPTPLPGGQIEPVILAYVDDGSSNELTPIEEKTDAILVLFGVQLACLITCLGLVFGFLHKHRRFHRGECTYETTQFFHSYHKGIAVVSIIYLVTGIISFVLLGQQTKSHFAPIIEATIAFFAITFVCLFALLFTLKIDARRSERREHDNIPNTHYLNNLGGYGKPPVMMFTAPVQDQTIYDYPPAFSMPQPHIP